MIRFETTFGEVTMRFRHTLPSVTINRNNDLVSMVQNMKITQGSTECRIIVQPPSELAIPTETFGRAFTHPSDQYKKELGRRLSLERAVDSLTLTEKEKREIMTGYYAR